VPNDDAGTMSLNLLYIRIMIVGEAHASCRLRTALPQKESTL
jgi:hypothetical protein